VPLLDNLSSALLQLALIGGIPFLLYFAWQKLFRKRNFQEAARRAGLQLCEGRYIAYGLGFALLGVAAIVIYSPPLEPLTRQGSAQRQFISLGFTPLAIAKAFLYGAVQTGLTEELLFRGMIAGSLSRCLSFVWANLTQAFIFFLPHLLILAFAPELWPILPLVFIGALLFGWLRIKSGSIIPSWLMHASGNVAIALSVAIRTAP